ncbi:xylulokinase [Streptomyces paludis]|uniref:Xylulose kinase n=1 Tax=Streptomyces paludis TaxID=2282738 RepID=A0A345HY83_9ACTN|nr:xylulokinase [Streptomyces paludis]AXG81657.1 xylulokinase [Streptomyces paludis]
MTGTLVAGVDSSTQSCKVELRARDDGRLMGSGSAPHPPATPPASEQDPGAWWDAFVLAFSAAVRDAGAAPGDVSAISVAAQCHGLVVLDAHDEVIRPAKLWNDTTSTPELLELRARIGDAALIRRTGSLPTAAFTLSKIAWLARHEPHAFARVRRILLPHDYLTFRLTGRAVTDRSEASGTAYYDAAENRYLTEHLDLVADADWLPMLPAVLGPDEPAGEVTPAALDALGLRGPVLVGAGGGDQHAAALGLGMVPGDLMYSFGTSGVVMGVSEQPVHDPEGFVDGVADMADGYVPLVSTLNAAKVTDTFARLLGVGHEELSRLALRAPALERRPVMAAYLDGERKPNRPAARGLLSGITSHTTREQLARAAYEGVVFGLYAGQGHLERSAVPTSGRVLAVGGGARSAAYTQLLADTVRRPVLLADAAEATARGAAVQAAAVATGTPVVSVRDAWAPPTRVAAEPGTFPARAWDDYRATAAVTGLDPA